MPNCYFANARTLPLHGMWHYASCNLHRHDRFLTGLPSSMLFDSPFPAALQAHLPARGRRLRRCPTTPKAQSISVPVPNVYLVQKTGDKKTFRMSPATLHHHYVPLEPVLNRSATDQVKQLGQCQECMSGIKSC
jgi:hypothetical protein